MENFNAVDFEKNFFLQIRYCFEEKTHESLNLRFFGMSHFRKFACENSRFLLLLRENEKFCLFRAFLDLLILKNGFSTRQVLNWKEYNTQVCGIEKTTHQILTWRIYNMSDFEMKRKNNESGFDLKEATRQILSLKKYKASDFEFKEHEALDFEIKLLLLVRFWHGK